ncbi:MAG: efflux RND transporter periplasmic adaptor subunit [Gammaproteobacteria bacterium]|nr:efflux RND transporter periplasmic adaptor subunit [Gammaproteobacteria bacterium]
MKLINQSTTMALLAIFFLGALLTGCDSSQPHSDEAEIVKGPHGGRLLQRDDFTLELAIFETGVPPEFRAWASYNMSPVKPEEVALTIRLTRLGGKLDTINFTPKADALRGDMVIYEPHSFVVTIDAVYKEKKYSWQYDNFEGRTKIEAAVAEALAIETDVATAVVLQQTIEVYGRVKTNTERMSHLGARFAGVVKSTGVSVGDTVTKGQLLATVESNESLNLYSVRAPISGVVTQRHANPGEQTGQQALFTITDTSQVWVDLSIFPSDLGRVKTGAEVTLAFANNAQSVKGKISFINVLAEANQSVTARVVIDNKQAKFLPGSFVTAKIKVGEHAVPLAVKRSGLQAFRDFTVVYAQIGDEYEVRMLELGREDDSFIEVLSGLDAGTRYVTENSYVIKADIEKSGASHDH